MSKEEEWKILKGYSPECYKQKLALRKAGFRVREIGSVDHVHVDDWSKAVKFIIKNKLPGYKSYEKPYQ